MSFYWRAEAAFVLAADSMGRKAIYTVVIIVAALPLFVAMTIEVVYRLEMSNTIKPISQPTPGWPQAVNDAIWASFNETAPIEVRPLMPWNIMMGFVFSRTSLGPGSKIAGYVAQHTLINARVQVRMLYWHVKVLAMTIWLSRHWSAEEIIAEAGRQLAIGGNIRGIVNASDRLYGEDLSALDPGSLAALLALGVKGGGAVDEPQLLERRNRILRRMFENGSLDEDELHRALAQPLRLRGSSGALLEN